MTPFYWSLAGFFFALWLLAGGVVLWSIIALRRGWPTTSRFMSGLGPLGIFVSGLTTGLIVGFVAAHFFWPIAPQ